MSRPGNCCGHTMIESFFANLKTEMMYRRRFQTRQKVQTASFEFIEGFYNQRHRLSTLGYLSPAGFKQPSSLVEEGVH